MRELEEGICSINGVKANGVRENDKGVAVIEGSGKTVGVFTRNKIKAAPVKYTKKLLDETQETDYVIANSGCANAFTGEEGVRDAEWMASLLDGETCVCSTGVIGKKIDRDFIEKKVDYLKNNLLENAEGSENTADAIRTTDTFTKEVGVEINDVKVAGVAKGSGMIEPNMGTMLAFIYTDCAFSYEYLKESLIDVVDESFNMVVVDGDTSTNDSVLLTSTEEKQDINKSDFEEALSFVSKELAKMIARDGEGSTKSIEVTVSSARNKREARDVSKEVLRSPLVKTMFYGENPNLGRVVSAIGNSNSYIEENKLKIKLNDLLVTRDGEIVAGEEEMSKSLSNDEIELSIDLGLGKENATAWGCDLSPRYVEMNTGYL